MEIANSCLYCKKILPRRPPSHTRKYCNMVCMGLDRRTIILNKSCAVCKKEFTPLNATQNRRNETCSTSCGGIKARITKPTFKKKRPTCGVCSKVFEPKSRVALDKPKFCSYACMSIWKSKDPISNARLKKIANLGRKGWNEASINSYKASMSGSNNPAWKGGVTYKRNKGNYIGPKYVRCPREYLTMSRTDGYVMEHRLVMAMHLGRALTRIEVVHHLDHNTRNNDISNLQLFANNKEHKTAEGLETKAKKEKGVA